MMLAFFSPIHHCNQSWRRSRVLAAPMHPVHTVCRFPQSRCSNINIQTHCTFLCCSRLSRPAVSPHTHLCKALCQAGICMLSRPISRAPLSELVYLSRYNAGCIPESISCALKADGVEAALRDPIYLIHANFVFINLFMVIRAVHHWKALISAHLLHRCAS